MTDDQLIPAGPTAGDIDNAGTAPAPTTPASTAGPVDPHAGFAVYNETLERFVSEVHRDGTGGGKSAANAAAAELRKRTDYKGHTLKVRPV